MALIRTSSTWVGSAGSPYYTQLYWLGAGDVTHANDALAALNLFTDGLATHYDNALSVTHSGEVEVIDVGTGQITSVISATEQTSAGTASGEALPPFTQMLLRFQTGTFINGRGLRGRMFFPGQMEASNTVDGKPSAGVRADFQANLDILVADSADLAVYSRTHGQASSVQGSAVWSEWAVLRSRRD